MPPDIYEFREHLKYLPETGLIYWKKPTARNVKEGDLAGCYTHHAGYVRMRFKGAEYSSHRVAWFLHYGKWPDQQIDHINGIKSDNRICNLRDCSASDNFENRIAKKTSATGLLGVTWCNTRRKFRASICKNGKPIEIGVFDTSIEAHEAYKSKKRLIHTFNPEVRYG